VFYTHPYQAFDIGLITGQVKIKYQHYQVFDIGLITEQVIIKYHHYQ